MQKDHIHWLSPPSHMAQILLSPRLGSLSCMSVTVCVLTYMPSSYAEVVDQHHCKQSEGGRRHTSGVKQGVGYQDLGLQQLPHCCCLDVHPLVIGWGSGPKPLQTGGLERRVDDQQRVTVCVSTDGLHAYTCMLTSNRVCVWERGYFGST